MTEIEKYLQEFKKTASIIFHKTDSENEIRNYFDLIISKITLLENAIMTQAEKLQQIIDEVKSTKGEISSILVLQKKVFAELRKMNSAPGGITDAQIDELEAALADNVAILNEAVKNLNDVDAENPDEPAPIDPPVPVEEPAPVVDTGSDTPAMDPGSAA